jgi:hypothetical protein
MKNRHPWLFPLISSILALSNLMCGFGAYDFDQDLFTKTEPSPFELAGVYIPTNETTQFIKDIGKYDLQNMSVTLFLDGGFEMQNMPDWWNTPYGTPKGEADCGKGKWKVVKQDWWWQVEFESGYLNSENKPAQGFFRRIGISGEQPPYSLWFYIGDVDKGDVMVFKQITDSFGFQVLP